VAKHHDLQLLELLGAETQRRELQKASEYDIADDQNNDQLLQAWLASAFPDKFARGAISALHHLGDPQDDLRTFDDFFSARR
jgi:hypothetical protein